MNRKCLVIGILFSLAAAQAKAQVQEIVTDRPDQSNTPVLIPKGALQVETGVIMEKDDSGEKSCMNYTYNNTLLKFGVNENFEARLAFAYLGVKQADDETSLHTGLAPLAVGVKIKLADEHGLWPQTALISNVTVKTGSEYFTPPFTCTDLTFALAHSLGSRFSLTVNGGVKWNGDSPEAAWLYTISAGYTITDRLAMFAESYGFFPEAHKANHRVDGGITYKIRSRLQFDVSGGVGLSNNSPKFFTSTGLSVRLFK